jgi:hypothetical protein
MRYQTEKKTVNYLLSCTITLCFCANAALAESTGKSVVLCVRQGRLP